METSKQRTERLMAMTHAQLMMHCQDLTAERDKLNNELGKLLTVSVLARVDERFPLVFASAQEALKESA